MSFPFDFGFIPGTKNGDGQPFDVIILCEFKTFPGCVIPCRIIGGLYVMQSEDAGSKKLVSNDRYIGIPEESYLFKNIRAVSQIPREYFQQIENFFFNYNSYEGKQFQIKSRFNAVAQRKILNN